MYRRLSIANATSRREGDAAPATRQLTAPTRASSSRISFSGVASSFPDAAQGALNAAAITSRLSGFYRDTVPAERFGEATLSLTELLDATFDGEALPRRCR